MRLFPVLAGALVGVWSFQAGAATLLTPDTAVASSQIGGSPATATIDGSGLIGTGATALHEFCCFNFGAHWLGNQPNDADGFNAASITWGFAAPVDLAGVYIWNNAFYPVLGGVMEFINAANTVIGSEVLALTDPLDIGLGHPAEFFGFAAMMGVSQVRFTLEPADYAFSLFRGLSEVRFLQADIAPPPPPPDVPPIPLPAAGWLLLGALGGLAALRRRRG